MYSRLWDTFRKQKDRVQRKALSQKKERVLILKDGRILDYTEEEVDFSNLIPFQRFGFWVVRFCLFGF